MQVCIADFKRKGQKDGAHDNLMMTIGASERKFGMPAFHQVADQVIAKFISHSHGILTFTQSLLNQLTG